MIRIKEPKNCCGCSACVAVCPKQCITMEEDLEGFLYPKVNEEICIHCGGCESVCPILHVKPEIEQKQKAYLLQIKDEKIRKESSSGGAFTAIASWIIKQGGIVFGAVMNSSLTGVEHRGVDNLSDLSLFRNSKYVQSDVKKTYNEVRNLLKSGRWVCYSGTPCQIEGLVSFLRKNYEKLVLIDVVCYGVPSPGIFRNYIKWQYSRIGGKFEKILFREKLLSYNYTSFSIYNLDRTKNYHSGVEKDKFMRSFFSNMNIRPSCYDCKFKKKFRISDFTIWDCYDVRKFSKNFDENGTNRVLVHTDKANNILSAIRSSIRLEQYMDIDYFIRDEIAMCQSVVCPVKRKLFFLDYKNLSFPIFIEKWYPDTFRVKINSWARSIAFKFGIYNQVKRIVKRILNKY